MFYKCSICKENAFNYFKNKYIPINIFTKLNKSNLYYDINCNTCNSTIGAICEIVCWNCIGINLTKYNINVENCIEQYINLKHNFDIHLGCKICKQNDIRNLIMFFPNKIKKFTLNI